MCRSKNASKDHTGRRCPRKSDPGNTQRNEQRRTQYRSQVNKKRTAAYKEQILSYGFNRFELTPEETTTTPQGFHATKLRGILIDEGLYDPIQVSGKLMPKEITPKTSAELGFAQNDSDYRTLTREQLESHANLSHLNDAPLTVEQKNALAIYSNYGFLWVADALHKKKDLQTAGENESDEELDLTQSPEGFDDWEDYGDVPQHLQTTKNLHKLLTVLDETIANAKPVQKTVYRGTNRLFSSMKGSNDEGQPNAEEIEAYLNKNFRTGKGVTLGNYASTSNSVKVAQQFGAESRVIFEIKTPEGLNVINHSKFNDEHEVILPRNTRYMVVGRRKAKLIDDAEFTVVQLIAVDDRNRILDTESSKSRNHPRMGYVSKGR